MKSYFKIVALSASMLFALSSAAQEASMQNQIARKQRKEEKKEYRMARLSEHGHGRLNKVSRKENKRQNKDYKLSEKEDRRYRKD